MSELTQSGFPGLPRSSDPGQWPARREALIRGLWTHLQVFVLVASSLWVVNWITRGSDGSWWVVPVLELWAGLWALHLFGAVMEFASHRNDR